MKSINTLKMGLKSLLTVIIFSFCSMVAFAQDKGADINVNVNKGGGGNWYAQPWVWIVGGAVFLLLLVALLRGGNNNNN